MKKNILILIVIFLFEALLLTNFIFSMFSLKSSKKIDIQKIEQVCSNKNIKCFPSIDYKEIKKENLEKFKDLKIDVDIIENNNFKIFLEGFFTTLLLGFLIFVFISKSQNLEIKYDKNNFGLIVLLSFGINAKILYLFSNNASEISLKVFLLLLFSISFLFFVSYFVLKFIFKNSCTSLCINILFFLILLFFKKIFPLEDFFQSEYIMGDIYLFIGFIVLVLILILLLDTRKIVSFFKYFTIAFLSLCVFNYFNNTKQELISKFKKNIHIKKIEQKKDLKLTKNIYIILLDMYAGDKTLKYLGFDNKEFYKELNNRKFKVYKDMQSNYSRTLFSVPAFLNSDYIENLPFDDFEESVIQASMFKILKENNYKIFYINPNLDLKKDDFDYCFSDSAIKRIDIYKFLLEDTAFDFLINFLIKNIKEIDYFDISLKTKAAKKMVFAHLMMPHHPYLKDENGNFYNNNEDIRDKMIDSKTGERYINTDKYIPYLKYSSKVGLKMIDKILEIDRNSIIIIMGDHGPQTKYFINDNNIFEEEMKTDKWAIFAPFNTFLAYYNLDLKEEYYKNVDTLTNFSRAFSNENFKSNFKLLKNLKFYYHNWGWKGGLKNAPGFYVD